VKVRRVDLIRRELWTRQRIDSMELDSREEHVASRVKESDNSQRSAYIPGRTDELRRPADDSVRMSAAVCRDGRDNSLRIAVDVRHIAQNSTPDL